MTHYSFRTQTAFPRSASALFALTVILGSLFPTKSQATSSTSLSGAVPQAELAVAKVQSGGNRGVPKRVYGHSVIPGGVRGAKELTSALERDKIVKAHYANFDAAKAYIVHVKSAKSVYVSYRMGDEIYWTKKKVRLAKGEELLTDGKSLVRARCGNRIADTSQSMVSSMEPAPEVLDTVLAPPQAAAGPAHHLPGGTGRGLVVANGMLESGGNFAAPADSIQAALLQSSTPVNGPADRRSSVLASAGPEVENPAGDILPVPVTLDTPTMPGPEVGMVTAPATVVAALLPTLSDLPLPSELLVPKDESELPEPGSIALMMLALISIALMRPRRHRK